MNDYALIGNKIVQEWQPIEAAPESIPVLVWYKNEPEIAVRQMDMSDPTTEWYSKQGGLIQHMITHWMPLPEPPV